MAVPAWTSWTGRGEDILIAGVTRYSPEEGRGPHVEALLAVMGEWTRTDADYATRVGHLRHGGGLNGRVVLNRSTVTNDVPRPAPDQLTGGADALVWFIVSKKDLITDPNASGEETITTV